jgi:hypothetical protein
VEFVSEKSKKPYVNSKLFAEYVKYPFTSHVARIRAEKNCSNHLTGDVTDLLSVAKVNLVTLAPHTTQRF